LHLLSCICSSSQTQQASVTDIDFTCFHHTRRLHFQDQAFIERTFGGMLKAQQATFISRKRERNLPNGLSAVSLYPLYPRLSFPLELFTHARITHHDIFLPKSSCATTHDFALADQLSIEFRSVESEVDVKVDAVESALGCVHALEVLFEVLS